MYCVARKMFILITLLPIFALTEPGTNSFRFIRSVNETTITESTSTSLAEPTEIYNLTGSPFEKEPEIATESTNTIDLRIFPVKQPLREKVQAYYVTVETVLTSENGIKIDGQNDQVFNGLPVNNYSLTYQQSLDSRSPYYAAVKLTPDQLISSPLIIKVGDNADHNGEKLTNNYANPPLQQYIRYRFGLAAQLSNNSFLFTSSPQIVELPPSEFDFVKTLTALFGGLIIILIVVIAGLIFYLREAEIDVRWQDVVMIWSKRHRSSLFKDRNPTYKRCSDKLRLNVSNKCKSRTYFAGSNYINMEVEHNPLDLATLIANLTDPKYSSTLQTEFNGIPFIQMPSTEGTKPENRKKNRYVYLPAYDFNRVKLALHDDGNGDVNSDVTVEQKSDQTDDCKEDEPVAVKPTDYINASYVDGYQQQKSYIATQGPLPWTFNDFWKMIWQQECSQIIMTTGLYESGRLKCHQYWPENEEITYGQIKVKHLSTKTESPEVVSRRFVITRDNESRDVIHYHYINWPDHGAPNDPKPLIDLIETVDSDGRQLKHKGPLVVHCSAGVGRTGTYIMIDIMIKMGLVENKFDILGQLYSLRKQRTHMLETEDQYYFVHQALAWYFKSKETQVNNKQPPESGMLISVDENEKPAIEP